jgi:hypothetical protein
MPCVFLPHLAVVPDKSWRGGKRAQDEITIFNIRKLLAVVIIVSSNGKVSGFQAA